MSRSYWRTIFSHPSGIVGSLLFAVVLALAALGLVYTPYDPIVVNFESRLSAPSIEHWLGTDEWGRDVASRILSGAVVSVGIALATSALATLIGTIIGAAGAFFSRTLDAGTMAVMDAILAFPSIILALSVIIILGSSSYSPILALSIAYLPYVVRVVRSSVLSLKRSDFVEASTVMGNSKLFTLFRHIIPNTLSSIIVLATSLFGWALLTESALSFLGLGVPPPASSWGGMLADSRNYFEDAPWLALAPGLTLSLALLGVNLFGDALRDYFDPRMNEL